MRQVINKNNYSVLLQLNDSDHKGYYYSNNMMETL